MTVQFLSTCLREQMEQNNYSTDTPINRFEFQKLLLLPEVTRTISSIGVDVVVLVDMLEVLYEDIVKEGKDGLEFEEIISIILNMRGSNPATVKDVKEQLRILKSMLKMNTTAMSQKLNVEFEKLHLELKQLRDEALKRDNAGYEDDEEEEEGKEGDATGDQIAPQES